MTRNPVLNACIELACAERDLDRAKALVDTKAIKAATERLRRARTALMQLGAVV